MALRSRLLSRFEINANGLDISPAGDRASFLPAMRILDCPPDCGARAARFARAKQRWLSAAGSSRDVHAQPKSRTPALDQRAGDVSACTTLPYTTCE